VVNNTFSDKNMLALTSVKRNVPSHTFWATERKKKLKIFDLFSPQDITVKYPRNINSGTE